MIPDWIGAYLFNASAIGAKQFVVQEAAEIIVSVGFNVLHIGSPFLHVFHFAKSADTSSSKIR